MLSTPEGIERLARERLGLVRPEELVIYTVNENEAEQQNASQTIPVNKPPD
jgi:cell division protein FtsB